MSQFSTIFNRLRTKYTYYRSGYRKPQLVYQTHSLKLIAKEEQELPKEAEIYFRGKPINQLTKTYIIIWNSGQAIIKGEDIVKDNPPTITFEEGSEILNTYAKATRDTSKFTATLLDHAPHTLICNFDYLEPGDGAAIEILHTSALRKPTIQGAIRGILKGIFNYGEVQPYKQGNPPLSLALHFFIMVFCVFMAYAELTKPPHERLIVTTLAPFLGSTFSLASLIYLIIRDKSRHNPPRLLTELLRTFDLKQTEHLPAKE